MPLKFNFAIIESDSLYDDEFVSVKIRFCCTKSNSSRTLLSDSSKTGSFLNQIPSFSSVFFVGVKKIVE